MPSLLVTDILPDVAGKKIGLIGAGRMGTGMGMCLLRHGAKLSVKANSNRVGIEQLLNFKARECATVSEVASSVNYVMLSLPSSREVEQVCLGANGLFANLSPDSLIIDCTTASPKSTLMLAEQAVKHGLRFVDAPVTRSPEHAHQGKLNAIIGASETDFPIVAGIVAAFSEGIIHAGDVGQGHKMKLVYNSMTMGIAAVAAETCQLAAGACVNLASLRALVSRGSTNSGIFQAFAAFLLNENPDVLAISITNAAKDIACAVGLASETGVPTPVLTSAAQKLQTAVAKGKGEMTLPNLALG